MAKVRELNESAGMVVDWLNEAYAKEGELEADLAAHIALTEKASYKKRLQGHLAETKEHRRAVERRIKEIGGDTPSPGRHGVVGTATSVVGEAAGKAVAAVKGELGVVRAMVTEPTETHLRQAQDELREEHVEIALYARIEALAEEVGDRETAALVRRIRRQEERMATFLAAELVRLVKDLVRAEIPRDQRATPAARRRTGARSSASGGRSASTTAPARARRAASSTGGSRASRTRASSSSR